MANVIRKYIKIAKSVLKENQSGAYTKPSSALYPHQWNWDSGFIAIGYSHYDTGRAMNELKSLFGAQWKNGMLPQIVFNRDSLGNYFPEPDFWQTERSPNAPDDCLTSGITMPPIHAAAALKIYENARDNQAVLPFLRWIYPRLMSMHRYLYTERNPDGNGLIYIRHPWESGMDNSPSWDKVLRKIDLSIVRLPAYNRRDTEKGVDPEMRPTKKYYDYFVYLIELFKKQNYNEKAIADECPFLVYDPLFNAILCASNEALVRISDILGEPYAEIRDWYEQTSRSLREKLYNPDHKIFDAVDIRDGTLLNLETASGFIPLFGGAASREQALQIYEYLNSKSFCALHQGNCFTIPSYDTQKEEFKRENYWRGPVWININWMLLQGLKRYGFIQKADSLARDILQLPIRFGFYEYYDSFDGRGYGSQKFSWTASLFIDTAYETYIKTGEKPITRRARNILFNTILLNQAGVSVQPVDERISQKMIRAVQTLKVKFYTPQGTVDYHALKASPEYDTYKAIAAKLREFDPGLLKDEDEKLAFWINLYNTIVVDGIIATGIQKSVKEIVGFFSRIKYRIGTYDFSPDDIEHGILRSNRRISNRPWKQFSTFDARKHFSMKKLDPRIHFALVCGSRSCAPITHYTSEGIHDELDLAAKNFINSSEVILIPEENRVFISSIFKWYHTDFGGSSGVLAFIQHYITDRDKQLFLENKGTDIRIDYLFYDWNLNR